MATGALMRKGEDSRTYSYSSQPRVVQQRSKYREPETTRASNIMYDRRIVRGNTYALHSLPASSQPNPLELQRQQESRRRVLARKRIGEQMRIRSPPPVDGRKHVDIQTELYLEEITDKVEEADVSVQTDAFLDRPPTPLFIPAKTGVDVSTQIEEGDLFDFDLEVKPILEVLVGKTVEQALLEVMEEEELAALREQQRIFEENRNAELVETQRLEEQERRNREEKERRMQQKRKALLKEKETAEKVSARAFAQGYLSDLVPAVFTRLNDNGFFYDPVEREIETVFMPWLMTESGKIMDKQIVARQLLDVILTELVKKKLGLEDPPAISSEEQPINTEDDHKEEGETVKEEDDQPEQKPPVQEESVDSRPPPTEETGHEETAKEEESGEQDKPITESEKLSTEVEKEEEKEEKKEDPASEGMEKAEEPLEEEKTEEVHKESDGIETEGEAKDSQLDKPEEEPAADDDQ